MRILRILPISMLLLGFFPPWADAALVPSDFFATTPALEQQLGQYDGVPTTSNWDDYYGDIKWDDVSKTNVPIGYRVWFLDDDMKPCGFFDIASTPGVGLYGFLHMYEDDSTTPSIDEGANSGDSISVLVEEIATNTVLDAWFVDANYDPITVTFSANKGTYQADVLVIPEPATLSLFIIGSLLLTRRKRR